MEGAYCFAFVAKIAKPSCYVVIEKGLQYLDASSEKGGFALIKAIN
jgi:hypothetical protein